MIPAQSLYRSNPKFDPFKILQPNMTALAKANVSNSESILNNSDEILKTQLLRKKEKYAVDCPLCKSKVMPFRIDFSSVIFVCVNQEVN